LQSSELIVTIAFAFAFVSTLRFYRGKVSVTPVDRKEELTPTLIISVAFLVGSISAFLSLYSLTTLPPTPSSLPPPSITSVYPWVMIAEVATSLFGFTVLVAVIKALGRRQLYALPIGLLAASWILSLLSPKHPLDAPFLPLWLIAESLMLVIPMVLFGYLWRRTRRPTAFGMFIGLLLYYFYFLYNARTVAEYIGSLGFYYVDMAQYIGHVEQYQLLAGFIVLGVFDAVASLFFVYWCFRYSEKKLGGEVIGYSLSTAVIAADVSIMLLSFGAVSVEYSITLLIMAIGTGVFILTASYLYGRYREVRRGQTLILSFFSFLAGLDFLAFNVGQHLSLVSMRPLWFDSMALTLGMLTGGFLFIAAMYAIGRKSLILIPPIVILPFFVLGLLFQPLPLWLTISMAGAAIFLAAVPGLIFVVLLRRMSKTKEKGRGRLLGILLGFVFMMISSPIWVFTGAGLAASLIGIVGAFFALLASLYFYLGISGRFDKWFFERRRPQ
jgi:hypothetical protein